MEYQVIHAATLQDITFADSIATSHSNESYCGTRTYSLYPNLSFLSYSGTTLSLSTSYPTDVSSQTVTLTIGLASYTNVPTINVAFKVTVTCKVLNLVFSATPPTSTTMQAGVNALIPFSTTKSPKCD